MVQGTTRIDAPHNKLTLFFATKNGGTSSSTGANRQPLLETETLPSAKFFVECQKLGTRQRPSLPNAALGKELHSTKSSLPSAGHSTNNDTRQRTSLPSARLLAKSLHSA